MSCSSIKQWYSIFRSFYVDVMKSSLFVHLPFFIDLLVESGNSKKQLETKTKQRSATLNYRIRATYNTNFRLMFHFSRLFANWVSFFFEKVLSSKKKIKENIRTNKKIVTNNRLSLIFNEHSIIFFNKNDFIRFIAIQNIEQNCKIKKKYFSRACGLVQTSTLPV